MHRVIIPKLKERRRKRYGAIGRSHLAERFVREISATTTSSNGDDEDITFPEALLRMFRHGAVGDQSDSYIRLGELPMRNGCWDGDGHDRGGRWTRIRVHVMWGSRDDVANEDQIYGILGWLGRLGRRCRKDSEEDGAALERRGVTFAVMEGLEHNFLMSHPEICADSIVDALWDR